jgi:solute carrier organic anion transporter family protein 1B
MASGMFLGGYLIKRLKLTLLGITKFVFFTTTMAYVFYLSYFLLICENKAFAGLTLTYDGFVYIILSAES